MQLATALNNFISLYSANAETSSGNDYLGSGSAFGRKRMRRFFKNSNYLPFIIVGAVLLIIILLSWTNIFGTNSNAPVSVGSKDKRVEIIKPKAHVAVNKSFEFPIKDQAGKEVSKLKYEVQSAELRDEIVIKGERATAVKGKTFLIVNLKVTNSFDKSIQINVKDYVRLMMNNSDEKIAPDIHNDPVDVLAISTKLTRVGFPVNDTDTNLTLQIGEINGSKQIIKLDLK